MHAGYRLELLNDHFADPMPLVERLRVETRTAIAHPYLKVDARHGLTIAGDVVAGRLEEGDEEDDFGLPEEGPRVIVDGQSIVRRLVVRAAAGRRSAIARARRHARADHCPGTHRR